MQLKVIDKELDFTIHNISILPSDQCATEEQRTTKCCCGTGFFYDFPKQKCLVSAHVAFMFGQLNNSWSHVTIYIFFYPLITIGLVILLSTVVRGMGKKEKRDKENFYNPLNQLIWILCFCGWIDVLIPLPFIMWYYYLGHGLRNMNQTIEMCHLFHTTMEVLPHTIDTIMTHYSILLTIVRFLTQYHQNSLKLRTIERFSRAIWSILFVCLFLGILQFFEHDMAIYTFCMNTEPGPYWASRCMVKDGLLITFVNRKFWKIFLPLTEFVLHFFLPSILLILLHIGFNREPKIDFDGLNIHNRFGRSPRDQTRILIYTVTVAFIIVKFPTIIVTIFSLLVTFFQTNKTITFIAILIGHLQPFFSISTITANCGTLIVSYYVIVKDEDQDVGESKNSISTEGWSNSLIENSSATRSRQSNDFRNYLTVSQSFDNLTIYGNSRRSSDFHNKYNF